MSNKNQVTVMAERLNLDPAEMNNIVINTIMPAKMQVTNEQFISFLAVANEYKLNPLSKEIYAFPAKGGGIQPIVSIDGWLKIINSHPDFNGMTHEDIREGGKLIAITTKIYKKGIDHPITVTEYMDECKRNTDTWNKYESRMLRHKSTIQCGRYAFGLSGIIDPDEAERFESAGVIQTQAQESPQQKAIEYYTDTEFNEKYQAWAGLISSGKKQTNDLINMVQSKGKLFTDEQKLQLASCEQKQGEVA